MSNLELTLPLPYKSQAKKRKSDALMTVNVQRNLHFRSASIFKNTYGAICREAVRTHTTKFKHVKISYVINTKPTKGNPTKVLPFRGSKPKNVDLLNVGAVIDKVLSDILVSEGIIPDDTISIVQEISFRSYPWAESEYVTVVVEEQPPITDPRIKDTPCKSC